MRLIDADDLKKEFCGFAVVHTIDEQPTAYDIDKVVEELEKLQKEIFSYAFKSDEDFYEGQARGLDKAIEIVKRGGKE